MLTIDVDVLNLALQSTDQTKVATVGTNMFGGILTNIHTGLASSFAASVEYMNLTNIRFPGGQLSETGSVYFSSTGEPTASIIGADQAGWMSESQGVWNYAYDLSYPSLINPTLLAGSNDLMSIQDVLKLSEEFDTSVELILPTVRYSDLSHRLNSSQRSELLDRCGSDVAEFLQRMFVDQEYGKPAKHTILDIGNENLVWAKSFPGQILPDGEKFDPLAVEEGLGFYFAAAQKMLEAATNFRSSYPDSEFSMAIQIPFMNNQPGVDDPYDVFLSELKALSTSELAQIDIIRFHALDYSFEYSADIENWLFRNLRDYAAIINSAREEFGVEGTVQFAADAYSANGAESGAGIEFGLQQSLQAGSATIAEFSSLVEVGASFASAWGIAMNSYKSVQASYFDPEDGMTHYTPRGEVLRQMSESLAGTHLVNVPEYIDAGRSGPVNLQVYGDSSKYVIFLTANDIRDGDENDESSVGEEVTISLAGLEGNIEYAWLETITTADRNGGEAIVWNPLLDTSAHESGEMWISYTESTLTVHLTSDFEIVRLIVDTSQVGSAPENLVGDSRKGFGFIDDHLAGGNGDDLLLGLTGRDVVIGHGGDDTLYGDGKVDSEFGSSDYIKGGAGNDLIFGGEGDDIIFGGAGVDGIYGGDGDDVLYYNGGADYIEGGEGFDTLYVTQKPTEKLLLGVMVGKAETVISMFEKVIGGAESNNFVGNGSNNVLHGSGGSDLLSGWGGQDTLRGGSGSDKLWGVAGSDLIFGGDGCDTLGGGPGNDTLSFGARGEGDVLSGGGGADVFRFFSHGFQGVKITDFSGADGEGDRISIDVERFGLVINQGALSNTQFYVSSSNEALDVNDLFVFRTTDNTLWIDLNGTALGGASLVADFQDDLRYFGAMDIFFY